jgi:hypothetical protein
MASRNYTALTLKRLYSLAGNTCSHPNCQELLLGRETVNLSEICHIEALNPGGPRYNSAPSIKNKDRNDYPNLLLLCKNHHGIIDETDSVGAPIYSVEQLKAMKQTHEDAFEASRSSAFAVKSPSLIAKVIKNLSSHIGQPKPTRTTHAFEIDAKIDFNQIDRHAGIIQKYSAYFGIIDPLYNEFEPAKKAALLESFNDLYLTNTGSSKPSDEIWDEVEGQLIERVSREANLEYSEELEWCVKIIMVDAFMRCKILEEPQ